MAMDTTDLDYWLNWRFYTCAAYVVAVIVVALILIWKYEGSGNGKNTSKKKDNQPMPGYLHKDEPWMTSLTGIHPAWLLAYRLCAFVVLLAILVAHIQDFRHRSLYFYTQWTFILVTIYFAVGSAFSIYGCRQHCRRLAQKRTQSLPSNADRGTYEAVPQDGDADTSSKEAVPQDGDAIKSSEEKTATFDQEMAGIWGYSFQVIFQVSAGAALLSDSVFWFLIYPLLLPETIELDFMMVSMHSFNLVFLIGDAFLSSLRFPFFRIAYFALFTITYVIFQWVIHACYNLWWPYLFLDLASPYAPAWYLGVGLIQLPCFGLFALILRFKNYLLSKSFPESVRAIGSDK